MPKKCGFKKKEKGNQVTYYPTRTRAEELDETYVRDLLDDIARDMVDYLEVYEYNLLDRDEKRFLLEAKTEEVSNVLYNAHRRMKEQVKDPDFPFSKVYKPYTSITDSRGRGKKRHLWLKAVDYLEIPSDQIEIKKAMPARCTVSEDIKIDVKPAKKKNIEL